MSSLNEIDGYWDDDWDAPPAAEPSSLDAINVVTMKFIMKEFVGTSPLWSYVKGKTFSGGKIITEDFVYDYSKK